MTANNSSAPNPVPKVAFDHFSAWFEDIPVLRDISLEVFAGERLALIGPNDSGKTVLLRSLNRLHDLTPGFRHEGRILLDGHDIFAKNVDVAILRQRAGLMTAPAASLPMSIFENIALALKLAGEHNQDRIHRRVETSLKEARLWDDVKDLLHEPAIRLTTAQARRLSLARTLAMSPEILLLDQPCNGLDNLSATMLEDILDELKTNYAIVFATNDLKQAARASDRTAFLLKGQLIEWGRTKQIFTHPARPETDTFVNELP
jgi:phosphate transport system ATP-binding protein